jgi:hypothetical protein
MEPGSCDVEFFLGEQVLELLLENVCLDGQVETMMLPQCGEAI